MRFLFRLDLSLHIDAGNFFGILIFGTKHGGDPTHLLLRSSRAVGWSCHTRTLTRVLVLRRVGRKLEGGGAWWGSLISDCLKGLVCPHACSS